jgi:hypothetical protein
MIGEMIGEMIGSGPKTLVPLANHSPAAQASVAKRAISRP